MKTTPKKALLPLALCFGLAFTGCAKINPDENAASTSSVSASSSSQEQAPAATETAQDWPTLEKPFTPSEDPSTYEVVSGNLLQYKGLETAKLPEMCKNNNHPKAFTQTKDGYSDANPAPQFIGHAISTCYALTKDSIQPAQKVNDTYQMTQITDAPYSETEGKFYDTAIPPQLEAYPLLPTEFGGANAPGNTLTAVPGSTSTQKKLIIDKVIKYLEEHPDQTVYYYASTPPYDQDAKESVPYGVDISIYAPDGDLNERYFQRTSADSRIQIKPDGFVTQR